MRNAAKLFSLAAFCGIALTSALAPANAFQLQEPVRDTHDRGRQSASAYTEDGQSAAAAEASVLSPDEVRHITWCAARYGLAYDAVNDAYLGKGGNARRCVSPR